MKIEVENRTNVENTKFKHEKTYFYLLLFQQAFYFIQSLT